MKWVSVGAVATVSLAMLAVPASASFDRDFTVARTGTKIFHSPRAKFRLEAVLADPKPHRRRAGRLWAVCHFVLGGERCKYHFRLNGRAGGFGNLRARGKLSPHDRHLKVIGGTRDFNGIAGKVGVSRTRNKIHF